MLKSFFWNLSRMLQLRLLLLKKLKLYTCFAIIIFMVFHVFMKHVATKIQLVEVSKTLNMLHMPENLKLIRLP
jgi:hypothetical protein